MLILSACAPWSRGYAARFMDGDHDPISELRETLRRRPATWELEQSARPRRPVTPRSALTRVPRPDPQRHLGIAWRRGARASRRILRSARSLAVALAIVLGVVARWAAHAALGALSMSAVALRAGALRLRSFGAWSTATAARVRLSRRHRAAPRAQTASPAEPGTSAVGPQSTPAAADDGERHLEELERRQVEQRVLALGPDHPDVAVLLQLVAERCAARGAPDEAIALYERALRIQQATFGPDSPALRPLLGDLAELERELGRDGDALLHEARRRMLEQRSAPADRSQAKGVRGAA